MILASLLAWFTLDTIRNEFAWRFYIVLATIPSWVLILTCRFIPESPRYYSVKGQHDNADLLVRQIFSDNKKELPNGVTFIHSRRQSEHENMMALFVPAYL